MDTIKIEISGRDPAAVQETYKRVETMFEVVDVAPFEDDPGFRSLEIKRPGGGRGWTVEQLPHEGARPAALLILGPAGKVLIPLNEVQSLREALAEAAAHLAATEAEARVSSAEGRGKP